MRRATAASSSRSREPNSLIAKVDLSAIRRIHILIDTSKEVIFYPRRHCPNCGSQESTWNASQGLGAVYTFSVIMQSRHPAFKDLGAYAVAYVDLDEGFRIMTNIVGIQDPTTDIQCGMRVKVRWEDQGEGEISLPMFEPA